VQHFLNRRNHAAGFVGDLDREHALDLFLGLLAENLLVW